MNQILQAYKKLKPLKKNGTLLYGSYLGFRTAIADESFHLSFYKSLLGVTLGTPNFGFS